MEAMKGLVYVCLSVAVVLVFIVSLAAVTTSDNQWAMAAIAGAGMALLAAGTVLGYTGASFIHHNKKKDLLRDYKQDEKRKLQAREALVYILAPHSEVGTRGGPLTGVALFSYEELLDLFHLYELALSGQGTSRFEYSMLEHLRNNMKRVLNGVNQGQAASASEQSPASGVEEHAKQVDAGTATSP